MNRTRDAPSRRHALAFAAMTGGGVALLAALVVRLDADEQWRVDARVRELVSKHGAPTLRTALGVVGRAGTVAVYAPVAGMAMAWLGRRHVARRALPIGAAVGGAVVLGFLLKTVVQRPRPTGARGPTSSHPSFTSGHAACATALVGILG